MAFKILLTDHHSPIGRALYKSFEDLPYTLVTPEFSVEQWGERQFIEDYLAEVRPAIVVNSLIAAGEEGCVAHSCGLAQACAKLDLTLIHLSSHMVFGESQLEGGVLSEKDDPEPESDLGLQLLEIEKLVAQVCRSITLRIPWLLDSENGIIFQAAEALLSPSGVTVSENWRGTPVFVDDVVRSVVTMVQQILCGAENWGVFHFHSSDSCSEAEFVDYVARVLHRKGCNLGPVGVDSSADRLFEGNGWLVGNRCTNCFGIQYRSWRQGTKGRLEYWLDKKFAKGVEDLQKRSLGGD